MPSCLFYEPGWSAFSRTIILIIFPFSLKTKHSEVPDLVFVPPACLREIDDISGTQLHGCICKIAVIVNDRYNFYHEGFIPVAAKSDHNWLIGGGFCFQIFCPYISDDKAHQYFIHVTLSSQAFLIFAVLILSIFFKSILNWKAN